MCEGEVRVCVAPSATIDDAALRSQPMRLTATRCGPPERPRSRTALGLGRLTEVRSVDRDLHVLDRLRRCAIGDAARHDADVLHVRAADRHLSCGGHEHHPLRACHRGCQRIAADCSAMRTVTSAPHERGLRHTGRGRRRDLHQHACRGTPSFEVHAALQLRRHLDRTRSHSLERQVLWNLLRRVRRGRAIARRNRPGLRAEQRRRSDHERERHERVGAATMPLRGSTKHEALRKGQSEWAYRTTTVRPVIS